MLTLRVLLLSLALGFGALGQPAIFPAYVRVGAALGSRTPVTASVALSNSDQAFEISVRYTSPAVGWLTVTPGSGTAPAIIQISADPSSLPEGSHSAQIAAYVGPMRLAAWATVSLVVAPVGVNPGGLAVNPSSLAFFPQVSTDPQTLTISNAPGIAGPMPFVTTATTANWLVATQLDSSTPGGVRVQTFAAGLAPGAHTGAVIVTASTGKSTLVPVTIVVPEEAIGATAVLTPAQRALTFNYQLSSTSNPAQTVYITTDSTQYIYFTATATAPWIGVAAVAWTTPAATASCFAPGLFYVTVSPTGMPAGVYQGSVKLTAPGVTPVEIPVTLNVSSTPVLNSNPSFIGLDAATGILNSTVGITASSALYFTAAVSANTPWLRISTNGAVATTLALDLTATADPAGLPAGTYNASITLTGPGGQPSLVIPVEFRVTSGSIENAVRFSPDSVDFSAVSGDSIAPQYIGILSDLGAVDAFSLATSADGGWMTAELLSSPRGFVKITANAAATPGVYSGTIRATSLRTGDSGTATVRLNLGVRTFAVSPAQLAFQQSQKGAVVAPQELKLTSNRTSVFRIVSHPAWVVVKTPATLATPATLVVSVDPGALAPGQYQGALELEGPKSVSVPISLTIAEPPPPAVSPSAIAFAYPLGGPAPAEQSVTVSNPTGSVRFTAQAATSSGIDWLTATPSAGTTPGTIRLGIDVARLTPGQHSGTVTIAVESAPAKTLTLPVTLTVTGAAVQVKELLNSATLEPTAVSPGMLVTLTGLGLGPDEPLAAKPTSAGAYATELAGVRVQFDGAAAPLLLVSRERIDAIVPYAAQGRATVRIQAQNGQAYSIPIEAKVVEAAPGIFTQSRTGKGEASALNADFTVNSVLNPARRGSFVVVYLTGEGQTDPPGQDGRIINTDVRRPLLPVTATIGGRPAEVLYAGSAPLFVSGICQVNVLIPETTAAGAQALEIHVGGAPSQRGVTVEVQ